MNEDLLDSEKFEVGVSDYEPSEGNRADDDEQFSCDEVAYGTGDAVFGSCIVAPLVVGVWRGGVTLMDLHANMFPFIQTFILGNIIHITFALLRTYLFERSDGAWGGPHGGAAKWLRERVYCRIYTYCFGIACMMHWRSGWWIFDTVMNTILPDDVDPHKPILVAAATALCYLLNVCLRASRNFLAPPYFIITDGKQATYVFSTRFKQTNNRKTILYVLDCIFSVTVVGSLVVFVWRGTWELLDIFLFPGNRARSCWTSLIAGYVVVAVTFSLQAPVRWAAARLHGAPRLLLADVYHLISFIATVNVWRGVWGLHDIYILPDSPKLSNWCSHIICFILLMLLNCSNSVVVRGVYIDAEEEAGECVVFPCHYLRLFFHKERTKKRHKRILAAAAMAARNSQESEIPLQCEEKV